MEVILTLTGHLLPLNQKVGVWKLYFCCIQMTAFYMRLLAEGNLFYTPQSQVWICAMCDAQYCQKKWRTCAPQVWLQKHIKSGTTKILFDLQDNAGKGCESENELEHVFLKGGIERWALEGQGTSRAEVLHWVVYNGDRALGVERRNHIKTEFSERAPLMLPNPDKPASHNTHSYTQLLPTGTYLWLLATSVCEVCVADVTGWLRSWIHLGPPSIWHGKLHAMARWQSIFPCSPLQADTDMPQCPVS